MGVQQKYFYIGSRKGASEKGDFFVVTLLVEESEENSRSFNLDFYVDAEMYVKASALTRFQAVDAVFEPRFDGKAKLVSIIGL